MLGTKKLLPILIGATLYFAATPGYAQVIASIDSGVLPGTPNTVDGGFNFFDGTVDTRDDTSTTHGTVVARVIASVFPGAQILVIKNTGPNFEGSTAITDNAINFANSASNVRIVLKSTGPQGSLGAWQNVVNSGKIAIMRAGNESLANPNRDGAYAPSLDGKAIVVGSSDASGNIASYSNRAGFAADSYILAPGFNQFSNIQGSSFAAPRVAAVAAIILQQNPNLSAEQVVEIILTTATDLGDPGVDAINGWGLLNPTRATAPIDNGGGGGSSGSGAIVAIAVVAAGAGIWAVLKNRDDDSLENTFFTDSYDRGYVFDLSERISPTSNGPNLFSLLGEFDQKSDSIMLDNTNNGYSYFNFTSKHNEIVELNKKLDPAQAWGNPIDYQNKLSFHTTTNQGNQYTLSINDSIRSNFGAFSLSQQQNGVTPQFEYTKTLTNPFLSFTDEGLASQASYKHDKGFSFGFGFSTNDNNEKYGLESDSAVIEGSYQKDKLAFGLQLGTLRERGSLFGGASGGVLSVDESNTISLGLSSSYKINDRFSVLGNYTEGYTKVDDTELSYLQNFSSLRSSAFGIGILGKNIFSKRDQLGFGYSRPLKIKSGSVDLNVPQGRDDIGEPLFFSNDRINLNPTGTEQAFEAYYSFQPKKGMHLTTYFLHQKDPFHDHTANSVNTVLATLKFDF